MRVRAFATLLTSLLPLIVVACGDNDQPAESGDASVVIDPRLQMMQASSTVRPNRGRAGVANWKPTGLPPARIRAAYGLPASGGFGTIAIVDAFDDPQAELDLNIFSVTYRLPWCTSRNGCFEKHRMAPRIPVDPTWALEISLDVQMAHAIAPDAKILLVEAKSASYADLLAAVDYARMRSDVVAVSMSWGGGEFEDETAYDVSFTSETGITFFVSSGDSGLGARWPSSSPNVVSVGGTSLAFNPDGSLASETAWSGGGGGLSEYEREPIWQYTVNSTGRRATPDVAANADPASGISVFDSAGFEGAYGWFQVGGTSAGTPLWAGIKALGLSADNLKFYHDAVGPGAATYFRDIVSGSNGSSAFPGYDMATGHGSPLTTVY